MRYEIVLTDTAKQHYRALEARWQAVVKAGLETHLRYEPTKVSKSRIKRLRGIEHPAYRLRLDSYRVFYDVSEQAVIVLAIVPKDAVAEWLGLHGEKSQ